MVHAGSCPYGPGMTHEWEFKEFNFLDENGNKISFKVPECSKCGFRFYQMEIIYDVRRSDLLTFLMELPEDKLKELLRMVALITDPLSQELLRKAAEDS